MEIWIKSVIQEIMQRKLSYNLVKHYFSLFLQKETIESVFIQLEV